MLPFDHRLCAFTHVGWRRELLAPQAMSKLLDRSATECSFSKL